MPTSLPRLLLALAVVVLLVRAGRVAWARRDLAVAVWRSIRPRHVVGSLALLVAVVIVSVSAAAALPVLGRGLGDLVATSGNAVFAPVDVVAEGTRPPAGGASSGPSVLYLTATTLFLAGLAALLPWFAFVEEEVFRAGAEAWGLARRVAAALVFGAAHLVMLVPLAAALGIAVAGFVYGEVYRHGVRSGSRPAPPALRRAFRPTRRSAAALPAATEPDARRVHLRRQVDGVFASTVWHTTFNTLVVALVWSSLVLDELAA